MENGCTLNPLFSLNTAFRCIHEVHGNFSFFQVVEWGCLNHCFSVPFFKKGTAVFVAVITIIFRHFRKAAF
jgi:hypothetical protein